MAKIMHIDFSSAFHDMATPAQNGDFTYTFGAVPQGDGTVRFRLWAPKLTHVQLEINGQRLVAMDQCGDGFHESRLVCAPGTHYRYRVRPDFFVPDPASRLQDGDVHDASVVTDMQTYDWRNNDWRGRPWTETVLYEIHCGLAGGFRGVQEQLASLAELGITAIELMPVADFSGPRNWGYDGVLPYAPDCAYGTPDELKLLIDTAHGMGLMVFLDVVYNHFGPDGNYLPRYAPDFYREDMKTPWGWAIDFRKPQVRRFFAENALYWLREYRFDGLRLDAVHAISEPGWLVELAGFVRSHIKPADRHIHLVLENDNNAASLLGKGFDAQWNDDAHHVLHHILTGETQGYYAAYSNDVTEKLARFLAEGFIYQGQVTAAREGRPRGEPSANLPPSSFVFFLQNHDQTGNRAFGERLISLCGPDLALLRAVTALQILSPHIPMLFMGEECGSTAPFQYFTSFREPSIAQAVRDGRRSEFAAFNAFSELAEKPGILDPNELKTWENCQISADADSKWAADWRDWYRSLLYLRREFITPHLPGARSDSVCIMAPLCVAARWRLGNNSLLSIYCNFSGQDVYPPAGTFDKSEFLIFDSATSADDAYTGDLPIGGTHATGAMRTDHLRAASTRAGMTPGAWPEVDK